jgi:hypothetical protein
MEGFNKNSSFNFDCPVFIAIVLKHVEEHQKRCGFCLNVGCSLNIVDSSVAGQGKSQKTALNDCKYFVNFNLKAAAKSTTFSPCTNHQVKFDLCQGIYGSYNLKIHYQQNHPSICFPDDKVISNKELSALKKLIIVIE